MRPLAIDFTQLFDDLGRIGHIAYLVHTHEAALPDALEDLYNNYDALTPPGLRDIIAPVIALNTPIIYVAGTFLPVLQDAAIGTLLRHVENDQPFGAGSVEDALTELIRQMDVAGETVERSVVSATASALAGNSGTGQIIVTTTGGNGLPLELVVGETAKLFCESSSYTGDATAGAEGWRWLGEVADLTDVWKYDWPAGSNSSAAYTSTDPDSADTFLVNGGFETFENTANVPDGWVLAAGVAGTDIQEDTSVFWTGAASVKLVGGATNTSITQAFSQTDEDDGSTSDPLALTAYGVSFWVRVTTVPVAGVLTCDLIDGTGSTVSDNEGTANTFTRAITTLTNLTWTAVQGVFRLPKAIPSGLKIRLRLSTALSVGSSLNIDQMTMAELVEPYPGGPLVGVFSGATAWAEQDGYTILVENNRGGELYGATFQTLFERFYGMTNFGLLLPSTTAGGETQPDDLITD